MLNYFNGNKLQLAKKSTSTAKKIKSSTYTSELGK